MNSEERRQSLYNLIQRYLNLRESGRLDLASEETIRGWLNEFLTIFDWNVLDTSQIIQERALPQSARERLEIIGSSHTTPDYTFIIGRERITFLDAKNTNENIDTDPEIAFQIKSYGWSISSPCAFVSNFEEFAIYDCTYEPDREQQPNLGRIYLKIDDYIENFQILEDHLLKENIRVGKLNELYSNLSNNRYITRITLDQKFAELLSCFRLSLARNIFENNREYISDNSENLSYIVQIIINRIIFVRICEARRIEENGLLLRFKDLGFWENFKNSSYFDFYDHYDGPLFDRINSIHNLRISNDVFDEIISFLYYPSPYRFEVIPVKILSDIYELFLSKKIVIRNGNVLDEFKNEYSRTRGAVSTPQYIIQDIIKRTIKTNDLINSGIENLFNTKILDLACGSGAFLIELYNYIEGIFIELYTATRNTHFDNYFTETQSGINIKLNGKRAIIDNCIFGVDIDLEAVEVTKMSLSLKIIDSLDLADSYHVIGIFGDRILNGVGKNIRCGNALIDDSIFDFYPELRTDEFSLLKINKFNWESDEVFSSIFQEKGGFDYIITNPPYVEVKNYNTDIPYMHRFIKSKFVSSINGKVDLAIPFIEKAIDLLNPEGRLGFIVQKRFFKTDYGRKIREIITNSKLLYAIIDFDTTSIFKGRMTYVALLILDKSSPESFFYKKFECNIELLPSALRETTIPEVAPESYITISATSISGNPWNFEDPELLSIKTSLRSLGSLGSYINVKVGIQVLWDKAYHIRVNEIRDGIIHGSTHLEEDIEIEESACRPLLCNNNFYSFCNTNTDIYVIFPYDVIDFVATDILFTEFLRRYPRAGAYLRRHKATIISNVETFEENDKWHLFTRKQNHGATYPKVLTPMTSLDTYSTVSFSDRLYCDNANVYFMEMPEKSRDNIYALSAIINSTLFSVLARSEANPQAEGYYKFNKQFIEPIPFPVDNFRNNHNNIIYELSSIAQQINDIQNRHLSASPSQKRTLVEILNRHWDSLDMLVYRLYSLSADSIRFFQNRGRNINRVSILG